MQNDLREITKIAREVSKFTVRTMKTTGIGTGEFDFIHVVRHNPGITQKQIREILTLDKGACARRAASLEAKGYLIRKKNPADRRSDQLFATPEAESLKLSKVDIETKYYSWLSQSLTREELDTFLPLLYKLYAANKTESKAGFPHVTAIMKGEEDETEQPSLSS